MRQTNLPFPSTPTPEIFDGKFAADSIDDEFLRPSNISVIYDNDVYVKYV